MSKLSTKDVVTGGGGDFTSKMIEPGNVKARIYNVELEQPSFLEKDDGYFLVLHLETEKPTDDFVGFNTVFGDESSPLHDGQIGKVKANRWAYKDGETKSGIEIKRDAEIMKFMKGLCEELDCMAWWNKVDNKYETIEDFIAAFNADAKYQDTWLNWCVGGRQYTKQNGYKGWDLHLPKFSRMGVPFESLTVVKKRLLPFDVADHTEITEPKPVDEFGGSSDDGGDDLPPMADAPEFEL